jgi:hypothetical protein
MHQISAKTMKILEKADLNSEPMQWINLDFLPDSNSERKEIYLKDSPDLLTGLKELFNNLFLDYCNNILIHNGKWWDFCLDVWDISTDNYDYTLRDKNIETIEYIEMLKKSNIERSFDKSCTCLNFNQFLTIILKCLLTSIAPYSPLFYSKKDDFFFYFHHTGSIGFYYKQKNSEVNKIMRKSVSNGYIIK